MKGPERVHVFQWSCGCPGCKQAAFWALADNVKYLARNGESLNAISAEVAQAYQDREDF